MGSLIYTVIASLDGYVADRDGDFSWAAPDEEVHAFVNDLERPVGTILCGRRLYEVMTYWDTASTGSDEPAVMSDFAEIWQAADKIIYSTTLSSIEARNTRLEREFDVSSVQELKDSADRPISIGGPTLASLALAVGLVDEIRLISAPVLVGGGTAAFIGDTRRDLDLREHRTFSSGFTYHRYST